MSGWVTVVLSGLVTGLVTVVLMIFVSGWVTVVLLIPAVDAVSECCTVVAIEVSAVFASAEK